VYRIAVMLGAGLVAAGAAHALPAPPARDAIGSASVRVELPARWTWARERGGYRSCTNPIVKLWLASYRLPSGFGMHEGPLVVPPRQVLLVIVARPV
jgi:hypothetical protein